MQILIAYDGSAGAEQSLRLAESVDWPADSTLRIAAVIEPTVLFVGAPMAGGFDIPSPEVDAEITAYQQEQVTKAARKLRSADRTVEGIVLRGRPATALVDEATRFGADLVMGGSRGHGTISSLLLGSVSAEVVDQPHVPSSFRARPRSIASSSPRTAPFLPRLPRASSPRGRSSSTCRSMSSASPTWSSRGTPGSRQRCIAR